MVKIVVDLQGADKGPGELIEGVVRALEQHEELTVYLCGNASEITEDLQNTPYPAERLILVDAPEVVTGNDDPMSILQTKKNSSLVKGMELCRQDPTVGAFVTCGATGAIFVAAMMLLRKTGKTSPMLLCELRKQDGSPICLVDCGANVDCRAEKLVDFARMGSTYMKAKGIQNPKVALLSNGTEDGKGNATVKKANALLHQSKLEFLGNVEGNHVLDGAADVIVCEGFSGNVLLKTIEGSAKAAVHELKVLAASHPQNEWVMEIADELYDRYDYNSKSGAVLLGVDLPVVKGHGAADADTVCNIIDLAFTLSKNGIVQKIKAEFES